MADTEIIIQEVTSPMATAARLQKFPLTTAPRIGEKLSIEGIQGEFRVVGVSHTFNLSPPKHTVWVTVVSDKMAA